MNIQEIKLFAEDLSAKINSVYSLVEGDIVGRGISHDTEEDKLIEINNSVYKNIWKFGLGEISIQENDKRVEHLSLTIDTAAHLGLPFSFSSNTVKALKVAYEFQIVGRSDGLEDSQGGHGKFSFIGAQYNHLLEMHFFCQENPSESIIEGVKQRKDGLVGRINSTIEENKKFLQSESERFKSYIDEKVRALKQKKVTENDLKNKF